VTPETKGPAAAATGRGWIKNDSPMMHHDCGRRNRRLPPAGRQPGLPTDASAAAIWLVRRFRVKPLLAEAVAGLAGLGGVRHGR
jgi:hypothetical protein